MGAALLFVDSGRLVVEGRTPSCLGGLDEGGILEPGRRRAWVGPDERCRSADRIKNQGATLDDEPRDLRWGQRAFSLRASTDSS